MEELVCPAGELLLCFSGVPLLYCIFPIRQVKMNIGMPMKGLRRNDVEYC